MENLSLTPATQAVLNALAEIGQGNVHELADKSGKARSTTDKAIKTLADAGLIVAVDTGADPADGTPTRWTLSETTAAALEAADLSDGPAISEDEADRAEPEPGDSADEPDAGDTEDTDQPDYAEPSGHAQDVTEREGDTEAGADESDKDIAGGDGRNDADDTDEGGATVVQSTRSGDRKVMAIKGVLADHGDGATLDVIVAESGISLATTTRLLTAMEQADAARRLPGTPERWIAGPTKASQVNPNPEPPRCPLCFQVIRGVASTPSAIAAVLPLTRPDGTLHVVGPDGEVHIVTLPTRTPPRAAGSLGGVIRRSDVTINADGNQPFGRGELEKLTVEVLQANPGRPMTPQDIATAIGGRLGRTVSSGAVRNNCTKAAAAGSILLVAETPLTFVFPAPDHTDSDAEAGTGSTAPDGGEQRSTNAEPS